MTDPKHSETVDYGGRYWCIKTDESQNGEIYVMADRMEITRHGDLLAVGHSSSGSDLTVLALAQGFWTSYYAASVIDGHAVAVEHWQGEIKR